MVRHAARDALEILAKAIAERGEAAAIIATGNSQDLFLEYLVQAKDIDWGRVAFFHMDEYLGIADTHAASFRRYLKDRVLAKVGAKKFHFVEGDALEPIKECERYSQLLQSNRIDLCCLGIGENGHLAFNDPPVADFEDPRFVKIVRLDQACRQQQVGEGHFPDLDSVPQYAITLTIPALFSAKRVLAIVPEKRKAKAVRNSLKDPVGPSCPGTFLRTQAHAALYLDDESSSLL